MHSAPHPVAAAAAAPSSCSLLPQICIGLSSVILRVLRTTHAPGCACTVLTTLALTISRTPYWLSTLARSCTKHCSMRSWKGRRSSVTFRPWIRIPSASSGVCGRTGTGPPGLVGLPWDEDTGHLVPQGSCPLLLLEGCCGLYLPGDQVLQLLDVPLVLRVLLQVGLLEKGLERPPLSPADRLAQLCAGRGWSEAVPVPPVTSPESACAGPSTAPTCPHRLVLGEATHDSRVHNAIEQHGEWVDGQAGVILVPVDLAHNFLIRFHHGLNGVFQGGDDALYPGREGRKVSSRLTQRSAHPG